MTLTDFLMARIADDEVWWRANREQADWCQECAVLAQPEPGLMPSTNQMLAECEAKRQIISVHRGSHECPSDDSDCGWWAPADVCPTLRLLALPYASHPDYREEWRP